MDKTPEMSGCLADADGMLATAGEPASAPYLAISRKLARLPGLAVFLGRPVSYHLFGKIPECAGVIAWGHKPSAAAASAFALRHALPLLRLEDGFLRSVGLGQEEPPLSIVVDDMGIYYDAAAPSRLEQLILQALTSGQRRYAHALRDRWRLAGVSKYNHAREYQGNLPKPYVLVADQVAGDVSIQCGLAAPANFQRMLAAALQENPHCKVVLKIHPGVVSGKKTGHFCLASLADNPRVQLIADDVHPVLLLKHAEAIYCVTSQIGFEGLLWGKRVRTFGMPFYAGWGLTEDELTAPGRRKPVALENLLHAALIAYPRYLDPETGQLCGPERVLDWLGLQRRMRDRFPAQVYAQGFSYYKRPIVRRFFQGSQVVFGRKPSQVPKDGLQIVWQRALSPRHAASTAVNTVRLEDGFIRSIGLGADLIQPLSWAIDKAGIYYDATHPSDLEHILQNHVFDGALLKRARALREALVSAGLTKYNVGHQAWRRPTVQTAVILVPGQVEADASLKFGAPNVRSNLALLKAVRHSRPQAYIVYKPHPDVVAGLRDKDYGRAEISTWCDEVVTDAIMADLLLQVDEVHTMTSLTGFEALLRGKKVVCYGLPFYAGWGLTEDLLVLDRRTRHLALDELVAGVLILYPSYISRTTGKFTTPERALVELQAWRGHSGGASSWWRKGLRYYLIMERLVGRYFGNGSVN